MPFGYNQVFVLKLNAVYMYLQFLQPVLLLGKLAKCRYCYIGIYMAYTINIPGIYIIYAMKIHCVVLMAKYAFLKLIGFDITLPSSIKRVYSIRYQKNKNSISFLYTSCNLLCLYRILVHGIYIVHAM
jgi:hypothetical protein